MTAPRHQRGSQMFASSFCPEPGAFTFIGCTILSMAWIFLQICWSYSTTPSSTRVDKKPSTSPARIITSIFYLIVFGILLLDGCWLITIYSWTIKQFLTGPTHGMIEKAFTMLMGGFYMVFLLGLIVLWVWTLRHIMRYVFDLWAYQHVTVGASSGSFKSGNL
ncbi:hypothetical protein F4860DRAFT_111120 [Xylaria cubensis]|nr:hypothetical protein F4860DRAFT_111120 [Xylaria cubensis]